MKHPANRAFYSYWDRQRGTAAAPERGDLDPDHVRHLLADIFVLSCDASAGYPFRVAGTRMNALAGHDLKGRSFTRLFHDDDRREIAEILATVTEDTLATVAGLTMRAPDGKSRLHLELLLLPFSARLHAPVSLTGLLAPLSTAESAQLHGSLRNLSITSWRVLDRRLSRPRILRKWSLIRGLTVYEGLR